MKSFIINDSMNNGYIVEIKNDTLEIYVPEHVITDYITVEDLTKKIPEEYTAGITKVIIGDRIKDISNLSFVGYDKLESIYLGADVEFVNPASVYGVFNLFEIVVNSNNKFFKVSDNVLFSYDMKTLIKYAQGKRNDFYEIPQCVEIIGKYAFECAIYLNCVKIGDNVKTIGEFAFHNAWNLRHIYIGEGVTNIQGRYVFGVNDEMQLFTSEWILVVGGKADSKIASWCENEGVNFYAIQDNELDDFLAVPLPELKPFPFGKDKYLKCSSKIKLSDRFI